MITDEYIVAVGSLCLLNCLMLGMSFCRVFDKQMTALHFSVAFLKQLAGGSPHIVTVPAIVRIVSGKKVLAKTTILHDDCDGYCILRHYYWEGGTRCTSQASCWLQNSFSRIRGHDPVWRAYFADGVAKKNTNQKSVAVVEFLLEMYTFSLVQIVKHVDPSSQDPAKTNGLGTDNMTAARLQNKWFKQSYFCSNDHCRQINMEDRIA